jgi:hypothetical protein
LVVYRERIMAEELLQQGITALKAGRRIEALRLLKQLTQKNPRLAQGWLWLSGAVDTEEEQRYCLTQVLSIDPKNAGALRGLEVLGAGDIRSPFVERQELPEEVTKESAYGVTCLHCGTVNPASYHYCDRCGNPLETADLDDTHNPR